MSELQNALIAFHNKEFLKDLVDFFKKRGYEVASAENLPAMRGAMGLSTTDIQILEPPIKYRYYVMDTNLGTPNGYQYNPAANIYRCVELDVKSGVSTFMSFTANLIAERSAREAGIPVSPKGFRVMMNFYESIPDLKRV